MSFEIKSKDYVGYIKKAAAKIAESSEYISKLDAATGDGDHWANINMGFESIVEAADELETMPMDAVFKKIGLLMMNKVGGSSGVLYGGAYISAGAKIAGKEALSSEDLCLSLETMVNDMMVRGKAKPGFKTMIDSLYPAVETYKDALKNGLSDIETLENVKHSALDGAEKTKEMAAVKGRASYQTNKGIGHLDPGAVTMSYQIECLCNYIIENVLNH